MLHARSGCSSPLFHEEEFLSSLYYFSDGAVICPFCARWGVVCLPAVKCQCLIFEDCGDSCEFSWHCFFPMVSPVTFRIEPKAVSSICFLSINRETLWRLCWFFFLYTRNFNWMIYLILCISSVTRIIGDFVGIKK